MAGRLSFRSTGDCFVRSRRARVVQDFMHGLIGAVQIAAGVWILWQHALSTTDRLIPFRATSAVVLTMLGVIHLWLLLKERWQAYHVARASDPSGRPSRLGEPCYVRGAMLTAPNRRAYRRGMLVGAVVCYFASLIVGSRPSAPYVFLSSLAVWHALLFAAVKSASRGGIIMRRFSGMVGPRLRGAVLLVYLALLAPVAAEVGLRLFAIVSGESVGVWYVASQLKLPAGDRIRGRTVNTAGYWDDEFTTNLPSGTFRVAALGGDVTLCGCATTNCLHRVEVDRPTIEIYNFGLSSAGPREYAAQIDADVAEHRPDLVLVFIAVGSDFTNEPMIPGAFDWQGLHLVQRQILPGWHDPPGDSATVRSTCFHQYRPCDQACTDLRVCRTPLDETMRSRWQRTLTRLDNLLDRCHANRLQPAFVIVPSEIQVDVGLLQTACRRAGCPPGAIDIDLPQRQLATYARGRSVPVLDLLPHLRASKKPTFARDRAVFNDHGNALAGDVLGEWLEGRFGPMILAAAGR